MTSRSPRASEDPLRGWVDDDLADRLAGEERLDIDLTAADLAVAEWARAGWRDRLARDLGCEVAVHLDATTVHGELVELFGDGLLLASVGGGRRTRDRSAGDVVIGWHAVRLVGRSPQGAAVGPVTQPSRAGRERPARALLRQWSAAGERVAVTLVGGRALHGRLVAVTRETVDVQPAAEDEAPFAGRLVTAAWHAVALVRLAEG